MNDRRKTILIALSGISPAVVTETVWALAHQTPPVVPDEVVVLTTKTGGNLILKNLKSPVDGKPPVWEQLKNDLKEEGIPVEGKLCFGQTSVHLFPDSNGDPLEDVRTIEDNERVADFMLKELRQYTGLPDDECRVLVSIAGGRKTMGALMFSCMTLVGRADDKIYHVLVNEPYDKKMDPLFFYPQKGLTHLYNGKAYKATDAELSLFEVPYVRMLGWYMQSFPKKKLPSYRTLITRMQGKSPDPTIYPTISIDLLNQAVLVDGNNPLPLSPQEFVVFVLFAFWRNRSDIAGRAYDFFHKAAKSTNFLPFDSWVYTFIEPGRGKIPARFEKKKNLADVFSKVLSSLREKIANHPVLLNYGELLTPKRTGNLTYPERFITVKKVGKGTPKGYRELLQFLTEKREA